MVVLATYSEARCYLDGLRYPGSQINQPQNILLKPFDGSSTAHFYSQRPGPTLPHSNDAKLFQLKEATNVEQIIPNKLVLSRHDDSFQNLKPKRNKESPTMTPVSWKGCRGKRTLLLLNTRCKLRDFQCTLLFTLSSNLDCILITPQQHRGIHFSG